MIDVAKMIADEMRVDIDSVIVDRRCGLLHRVVVGGRLNGRPCIVKWSDNDPGSIRNECDVGEKFYRASNGRSPEMFDFKECSVGAACVMERMEGTALSSCIDSVNSSPELARKTADQIDLIMELMRGLGMCHRDCSSANFWIAPDGTVKLYDFQTAFMAGGREPFEYALSESRAFIYKYRSLTQPVIGLFNDKAYFLFSIGADSLLGRNLALRWGDVGEADFYCPVGRARAVGFAMRSIGVWAKSWFAANDGRKGAKILFKRNLTSPTLRYWARHGVSGSPHFTHGGTSS